MRKHSPIQILLLGGLALLLAVAAFRFVQRRRVEPAASAKGRLLAELARQVMTLDMAEQKTAEKLWPKELLAERCGLVFEDLWDAVNAATDKLSVIASFPVGEVLGPGFGAPTHLAHRVELFEPGTTGPTWIGTAWPDFIAELQQQGWQLAQMELRQIQFDADAQGKASQSRFYFSANLFNAAPKQRATLEGNLVVRWQPALEQGTGATVREIDASRLVLKTRRGDPPFELVLDKNLAPPEGTFFIDPLILYDLDGEGQSEIILAARNLVFYRSGSGKFESRPLCRFPVNPIFTGLIADFDGDGVPDFLCAGFEGLYLFKGAPGGRFDDPGRLVWAANPHLKYGQALTCGDIDGDGDLDVWLGQYKAPYDHGQMPTPYYDANDGYPSYLLRNDGHGSFTDVTLSAGLGEKRRRRVYSASFVDLNADGNLDLLVASDFAGLELYHNDGHGRFTEVTSKFFPERHGFGMSQLCADFNRDGRLDVLMIGMNVPTMDRLLHLDRPRSGFENYLAMGPVMTSGNRLFLAQPSGAFKQTDLNASVARTGWSWGASALDLDNDGFPDLYVANGHESRQSVRDYETEFWMHDIYAANSRDNLAAFAYFQTKNARTRGQGMSYGGYERNRLFLNQHARSWVEVGFLMGVALGQDSRNVVADDLDLDGREDLLVTTFEVWPEVTQSLRVFRNQLDDAGNWIGFQFRERAGGPSPVGVRVTVQTGDHVAVQAIVAGDAYRSQRANTLHFGLGKARQVDRAEIRWIDGSSLVLKKPAINQYYPVAPPARETRPHR